MSTALFRTPVTKASSRSAVSTQGADKPFRLSTADLSGGLRFLIDVAEDDARRAARNPKPAVFCPPLAVFGNKDHARETTCSKACFSVSNWTSTRGQAHATLEVLPPGPRTYCGAIRRPLDQRRPHPGRQAPCSLAAEGAGPHRQIARRAQASPRSRCSGLPWSSPPQTGSVIRSGGLAPRGTAKPNRGCVRSSRLTPTSRSNSDAALARLQAAAPPEPQAKSKGKVPAPVTAVLTGYSLVNGIITGASYHASLVALAARLVGSRMHDGTAVANCCARSCRPQRRRTMRCAGRRDLTRSLLLSARRARNFNRDDLPPTGPLPFIDMLPWDSAPAPPRPWAVTDRIPINQPTLFSGEGAAGKTLVELQLCVAHVTGRDWLGGLPEPGPAIYYGAEDDSRRIAPPSDGHRRALRGQV